MRFIKKIIVSVIVLLKVLIKWIRSLINNNYNGFVNDNKTNQVIVMGNGPSLNELDFDSLNRDCYKLCCVNYFPIKNSLFKNVKPEYLCLVDPGFFDYTIPAEADDKKKLLEILEQVDWPLTLIVPSGKKLELNNKMISYDYINSNILTNNIFDGLKYYFYKMNVANCGLQNVTVGALYYFISRNFKNVFISGVDLSDFKFLYVDENNRVYVDSTHSYGSTRYYYDEMPECGVSKFSEILGCYQQMFVDYDNAKKYSTYMGVNVFNLSSNSYVDSFKKINKYELESLNNLKSNGSN